MDRRDFLRLLGIGTTAALLPELLSGRASAQTVPSTTSAAIPATTSPLARQPNIICILSDDVGLGDMGCYGGPFKTPHIDALATGGLRFERCYSTPLCGPSRCQLLTGQYPFRTGLISNQSANAISPDKQIMIPSVLKPAGYVTASVGKWGQMCLGPKEWGFDEYLTFPGSGKYWASQGGYTLNGKKKDLGENEYLPDVMHTFLVDFITRHREEPFFVYYPMSHIHGPILRTPDSRAGKDFYADNITYMDKLVGKLVAELERLKLRDNTLILFLGDNGTAGPHAALATVNGQAVSGQKGTMWEGGSRVPLIANRPGQVPAGQVLPDLVDFSDLLPTFAQLAGAALPKDHTLDGHSFAAQLQGQKGQPREWIYVELAGKRYVRADRWKLTGAGELYDLKDAPFKEAPVAADATDPEATAARKHLHEVLVGLVGPERLGGPAGLEAPGKQPKQGKRRRANQP